MILYEPQSQGVAPTVKIETNRSNSLKNCSWRSSIFANLDYSCNSNSNINSNNNNINKADCNNQSLIASAISPKTCLCQFSNPRYTLARLGLEIPMKPVLTVTSSNTFVTLAAFDCSMKLLCAVYKALFRGHLPLVKVSKHYCTAGLHFYKFGLNCFATF